MEFGGKLQLGKLKSKLSYPNAKSLKFGLVSLYEVAIDARPVLQNLERTKRDNG